MVLQRNKPVPIWGWADPGETVTLAFADQKQSATAAPNGRWMIQLKPMKASAEGRTLTVGNNLTLTNILVGDVWLCSGQSNMVMPVSKALNGKQEAAAAAFSLIYQSSQIDC